MNYDCVVSLGANCEVAHHIERHFSVKRRNPFDWWITPFNGLVDALETDFDHLFEGVKVEEEIIGNVVGNSVRCQRYRIWYHHDFPRDKDQNVIPEMIRPSLPALQERYAGIIERMKGDLSAGRRILFVRAWREVLNKGPNYPRHLIRGVPMYPYERLLDAISKRFPEIEFKCLFINYGDQSIDDNRAIFRNVENLGDIVDWTDSRLGWSKAFSSIGALWENASLRA